MNHSKPLAGLEGKSSAAVRYPKKTAGRKALPSLSQLLPRISPTHPSVLPPPPLPCLRRHSGLFLRWVREPTPSFGNRLFAREVHLGVACLEGKFFKSFRPSEERERQRRSDVQIEQILTMDALANASGHFALDLFQKLIEGNPAGNIFFSPFSIASAFAMVCLGAKGDTAAQLSKTFHFDAVEELHSTFQALNAKINRNDAPYILRLANRLYGEKTYNFLQDFLTSTQKLYGAELCTVDFLNDSNNVRKKINQWVEGQTEGKIHELLSAGSINPLTKMVLVNAIYFKGSWEEKFQDEDTKDMPFRLNKKEKKTVKMMFMKKKLPIGFIEECRCAVLELPYKGKELSMIILLPNEIEDNSTGLEQLEKQITLEKLQEWTEPTKMYSRNEVYVHLPKFKLEESYDLKSYLASLGLLDVFDDGKANLSGMSGAQDLHVSKVVHKSFIEVNEEGTEAAAATAVMIMVMCMPIEEHFNCDHPFFFFIRHNPTKSILFVGRFTSP